MHLTKIEELALKASLAQHFRFDVLTLVSGSFPSSNDEEFVAYLLFYCYIFPINRFLMVSLAVILAVL